MEIVKISIQINHNLIQNAAPHYNNSNKSTQDAEESKKEKRKLGKKITPSVSVCVRGIKRAETVNKTKK